MVLIKKNGIKWFCTSTFDYISCIWGFLNQTNQNLVALSVFSNVGCKWKIGIYCFKTKT